MYAVLLRGLIKSDQDLKKAYDLTASRLEREAKRRGTTADLLLVWIMDRDRGRLWGNAGRRWSKRHATILPKTPGKYKLENQTRNDCRRMAMATSYVFGDLATKAAYFSVPMAGNDASHRHPIERFGDVVAHAVVGELRDRYALLERALAICENAQALGPDYPDTATSLNNLACLLQAQGHLPEARPLFERVLAIHEKALGFDHPQTARSLDNLASLLQQQGNLTGARRLFERALAINESALSPEHPSFNRVRCNLARLLLAIGQPTEALVLAESALMAHDKILGPNQPWTQDSACVTAHALDVLDRSEEAAALRKRYGLTGA
jgi:hypothetical protein